MWISSPSNRYTDENTASHRRAEFSAIVFRTGWRSVGELEITRKISLVAVCCYRASVSRLSASVLSLSASAKRCSRSRTLEPSFFGDFGASGRFASASTFAGFARRSIKLSLPPTAADPRQPRRRRPREQAERAEAPTNVGKGAGTFGGLIQTPMEHAGESGGPAGNRSGWPRRPWRARPLAPPRAARPGR